MGASLSDLGNVMVSSGKKSGGLSFGTDFLSQIDSPRMQAPGLNLPKFKMRDTSEFMKPEPGIEIGGPGGRQRLENSFNGIRENAVNQANAATNGNIDAITRRFAAMGAGNSGAYLKALEMAQDQGARQAQDATNNIEFQREQALSGRDSQQAGMDFQNKVFAFDKASKLQQLDQSERQMQIDRAAAEYNAKLNAFNAQPPKQGLISSILGDIL